MLSFGKPSAAWPRAANRLQHGTLPRLDISLERVAGRDRPAAGGQTPP